jgi:hypothetical protein
MFVVRQAQVEQMLEPMRRRFVEGTRAWLRDKYARKLETMKDDDLRALIRQGIERAMKYGIDTEASMALFIELMVAIAPDFDDREEAGWLKGLLENPQVPAQEKAEFVHRQLLPAQE